MHIWRIPFQVQKVIGIYKQISLCTHLRWTSWSLKWVDLLYCNNANVAESEHILLASSDAQISVRTVLAAKTTETADGYVADSLVGRPWASLASDTDAGSPRGLWMGPDRNRHWFWTEPGLPRGRGKCLGYYERSRIEDTTPVWMADHHFLRPRNTLYSP